MVLMVLSAPEDALAAAVVPWEVQAVARFQAEAAARLVAAGAVELAAVPPGDAAGAVGGAPDVAPVEACASPAAWAGAELRIAAEVVVGLAAGLRLAAEAEVVGFAAEC
jgi:hypothetical protein